MKTKKAIVLILAIALTIILAVFSYVSIGKIFINHKMEDYLTNRGFKGNVVKSIEVKHSFLNVALSYNEWVIWVRYNDEPKALYFYTYNKGTISPTGVAGVPEGEIYKHGDPYPIELTNVENIAENDSKLVKRNLKYSLDITYSKSMMKFLIINYSLDNIELISPNMHTFDFILSKDGNVVFDNYRDDPNVARYNWETHQILVANGDINYIGQGYDIWYESLNKKFNDGIYSFRILLNI